MKTANAHPFHAAPLAVARVNADRCRAASTLAAMQAADRIQAQALRSGAYRPFAVLAVRS